MLYIIWEPLFFQAGHKQNYHRSAQNVPNEWLGSSLMSLQRQQPGRNKDRFMRSLRNFQHSLKAPRVQCSHAAKTIWPVKRTLSSSSFNKHKISSKAEMPLRRISVLEHAAVLKKSSNTMMGLATFIGLGWIYIASNMYPDGSASCCNCHCHGSKPEVQQN